MRNRVARRPREQAGDFDQFFSAMRPQAMRVARRFGLAEPEVEDIVIDAFVICLERWKRVAPLPYRDAWLMRTVINRALRVLKRKRMGMDMTLEALVEPDVSEAVTSRVSVQLAIGRLPRRERMVVAMRYGAGLSVSEIAQALSMKEGTVKAHAFHARTTLSRQLSEARP